MTLRKPCPWCGGEAGSWLAKYGAVRGTWSVGCIDHRCVIEPAQDDFVSQEEAEAAWNSRVVDAENERLRGVIDDALSALVTAKDTIADWHGEVAWDLYQQSPDIVYINTAISKCREALEETK